MDSERSRSADWHHSPNGSAGKGSPPWSLIIANGAAQGGQQPRDELNVPRQREDYSTAIGWAAAQPNIDEDRVFVWGTSFAGMHATVLAASDHRLAGAIAQCPLVDGLAGSRLVRPTRSIALFATAIIDRVGSLFGRAPIYLPVNVAPGEWGIADTSDALFGKKVMTPREPVDWHNRMAARSLLSIPAHRPVRRAGDINIPILSQSCSSPPNTTPRHRSVPHSQWPLAHPERSFTAAQAGTTMTVAPPSMTSSSGKSSSSDTTPVASHPSPPANRAHPLLCAARRAVSQGKRTPLAADGRRSARWIICPQVMANRFDVPSRRSRSRTSRVSRAWAATVAQPAEASDDQTWVAFMPCAAGRGTWCGLCEQRPDDACTRTWLTPARVGPAATRRARRGYARRPCRRSI